MSFSDIQNPVISYLRQTGALLQGPYFVGDDSEAEGLCHFESFPCSIIAPSSLLEPPKYFSLYYS